ncbi:unnamed protein product [Symbiodinium pilosum]|uniref:Uncharacterized protein n=1 Tax=Symbiodinium pilosum TaxID=2952 RepID=A0A812X647_SYMPI|nr:unnamed protein product [Symbiodinium pilosum]
MPFNRALDHIADCFQVTKEKMFGAVMLLDNNCTAFERIWCIFEGWRCSELGVPLLVFSPQGRLSRISDSEQSREMAKKVSNIDAERAVCSEMRDKLMIDSAIETIPGRFTTVVAKFRLQVLDVAPFDEPQAVVRAPAPAAGGYYSGPAHGALRGSGHP